MRPSSSCGIIEPLPVLPATTHAPYQRPGHQQRVTFGQNSADVMNSDVFSWREPSPITTCRELKAGSKMDRLSVGYRAIAPDGSRYVARSKGDARPCAHSVNAIDERNTRRPWRRRSGMHLDDWTASMRRESFPVIA